MPKFAISPVLTAASAFILFGLLHSAPNVIGTNVTAPNAPPPVTMPTASRRHCVFPFWWQGQWHHTCVKYNIRGDLWCSVTQNFTRDENWKQCDSHDKKRFSCYIPFAYGGRQHYTCLPLLLLGPGSSPGGPSAATFWCGLTPSVTSVLWLGTDWAFCEMPNATTGDYLKAVGRHRDLVEARTAAKAKIDSRGNSVKTDLAAAAAAAEASASAAGSGADDSDNGGLGWGAGLVVSLGVACALLSVAVVTAACTVHRKYIRGRYKRIDPLLTSDPMEKSSYGGVEAYHD